MPIDMTVLDAIMDRHLAGRIAAQERIAEARRYAEHQRQGILAAQRSLFFEQARGALGRELFGAIQSVLSVISKPEWPHAPYIAIDLPGMPDRRWHLSYNPESAVEPWSIEEWMVQDGVATESIWSDISNGSGVVGLKLLERLVDYRQYHRRTEPS